MDMDGVLVRERLIPGADLFVKRLQQTGHRFLPADQQQHLHPATWPPAWADRPGGPGGSDLDVGPGHGPVPRHPAPQGSAYVIGEAGLATALHERGLRAQ